MICSGIYKKQYWWIFVSSLWIGLASGEAWAGAPTDLTHYTEYIEQNGTLTYWTEDAESYVRHTLPNEWFPSWSSETLKAGAIIIRSGAYWRINRSILNSPASNANCYRGSNPYFSWYVRAPNSRNPHDGLIAPREEYNPYVTDPRTDAAVSATGGIHAERVNTPSGRPDAFVPLLYVDTQQNRTHDWEGDWLSKIRYTYTGSGASGAPFNPNEDCSQVDSQAESDPIYVGNDDTKGMLEIKATLNGSVWSGPISFSASGTTSFTGSQTGMYPNLPSGGYTVLYLSGGPSEASLTSLVPPASQLLRSRDVAAWTFNFTSGGGPFCSAGFRGRVEKALATACGGSLSVSVTGTGIGRVLSNPVGIDCPGDCAESFVAGAQVLLSASPSTGSIFSGWTGDPDCVDGSVTMNGNHSCTATFTATSAAYMLAVSTLGSGAVSSIDGSINCGGTCTHTYVAGATVTLTALPASGWSFSSWSGNCLGGPVAQVAMSGNRSCTANFVQAPGSAPETTTGSATNVNATNAVLSGTINPHGLSTTGFFEYGPDPGLGFSSPPQGVGVGNSFEPFSANVSGLACATAYRFRAVGVNAGGDYRASIGTFTTAGCPPTPCFALTLMHNGDGGLPIASPTSSSGCPYGQYHAGEHISLTALAGPGNIVTGWGGTDNNSSSATANTTTMPSFNWVVVVDYQHICYHLSLGYTGNGSTPVTTNPVAFCPPDYFPWGYEVGVNGASPSTGWQIGGWSGTEYDYVQLDHNNILMPQWNATALVQYIPLQYPLTVEKLGNGSGTVTSDVPGINCGTACSTTYPYGTTVTLSAIPDSGSTFLGFSGGACNGGVPSMMAYTVCSAVFGLAPNPASSFYTLMPCRVIDTRTGNFPLGAMSGVTVPVTGRCGVPGTTKAVAINVTAVGPSAAGFLSVYPAVGVPPSTWTVAFKAGATRAASTIVGLSPSGTLTTYNSMTAGQTNFLIDVTGYFQ